MLDELKANPNCMSYTATMRLAGAIDLGYIQWNKTLGISALFNTLFLVLKCAKMRPKNKGL